MANRLAPYHLVIPNDEFDSIGYQFHCVAVLVLSFGQLAHLLSVQNAYTAIITFCCREAWSCGIFCVPASCGLPAPPSCLTCYRKGLCDHVVITVACGRFWERFSDYNQRCSWFCDELMNIAAVDLCWAANSALTTLFICLWLIWGVD